MSYDLILNRARPGYTRVKINAMMAETDDLECLDEAFEGVTTDAVPEMRALAAALKELNPDLEVFESGLQAEQASSGEEDGGPTMELNDGEMGIEISLCPGSAAVSMAYWHQGDEARKAYTRLFDYVRVLERKAGYLALDAQLGRILDPDSDMEQVLGVNEDVQGKIDEVVQSGSSVSWLVLVVALGTIAAAVWCVVRFVM